MRTLAAMMSFLRLLLAFAMVMALLPDWPANAFTVVSATAKESAGYTSWMLGLLCGIVLTIAARVHWRDLPRRAVDWVRGQSARAGWATLGLCYAFILAFY
jgi:hypothetical protein